MNRGLARSVVGHHHDCCYQRHEKGEESQTRNRQRDSRTSPGGAKRRVWIGGLLHLPVGLNKQPPLRGSMSRSVGAWNGSFDGGNSRAEARAWSRVFGAVLIDLTFHRRYYRLIISVHFERWNARPRPPNTVRLRRVRTDIREALLESALVEFGAKGFDGASTRTIALRVQAHQPQINYHFESKTALWNRRGELSLRSLGRGIG
jgi:hypothetical protein